MKTTYALLALSGITNLVAVYVAAQPRCARGVEDTLRAHRIEIVNEDGDIRAVLASSEVNGGRLQLFHPRLKRDDGRPRHFASIGNLIGGMVGLSLYNPERPEEGAFFGLDDHSGQVVNAISSFGKLELYSGRKKDGDPVIRIADDDEHVIFEK